MPTLQNTYTENMPALYEGFIYNSEPHRIISRMAEGAAGLGFGKAVVQGTADNQVKAAVAGAVFRGVTVGSRTQIGAVVDTYPQYSEVNVMVEGPIAVLTSVNVVAGDTAYIVPATGVFTNSSSGNTRVGMFDSTAAAGALVKLRLG